MPPPPSGWIEDTLLGITLTRGLMPDRVMAVEADLRRYLEGVWTVDAVLRDPGTTTGWDGAVFAFSPGTVRLSHPTLGLASIPQSVVLAAHDLRLNGTLYRHVGLLHLLVRGEERREAVLALDHDTLHLTWRHESIRLRLRRAGAGGDGAGPGA